MDVVTCGEVLIDFVSTQADITLAQAPAFAKAFGGAPANVAVGVARLGCRAGFMGQVGDDEFGHFLAATLRGYNVDVAALRFSTQARTALAFVSLRADGERDFMFYRHPSADMLWQAEQGDGEYAAQTRIFHYGSISLIGEPSRATTLSALTRAKHNGALLSYDPNLRLPLWPSPAAARRGILDGWRHAQVIKVSEEELFFISQQQTLVNAAQSLWHDALRLLVVTQGGHGCTYFTRDTSGHSPGFAVKPVDTTGAGDGFVAGMLVGLLSANPRWEATGLVGIEAALRLGNAVGGLATTHVGAVTSLPTMQEAQAFLQAASHDTMGQ